MFYTVYKITNLLNEKYYIGKHKTLDLNDDYMGSGKLINRAINKYGIENFKKEILFVFDNEIDMNSKEKELVVICEQSYNLCPGGHGGFGYINANRLWDTEKHSKTASNNRMIGTKKSQHLAKTNKEWNEQRIAKIKQSHPSKKEGWVPNFLGKKHTVEHKNKMSKIMRVKQKGELNSQFGTCWINNGIENKKIVKNEVDKWINLGYAKGRLIARSSNRQETGL